MVYFEFDSHNQILITRFEKDVYKKEIIDYIDGIEQNGKFPRKLKILTDSSKSNIILKPEDLPVIVEANNKSLKVYDYIIDAIVVENPKDTALVYLFGEISKQKNYYFKLFSTYEAAKTWLLNFNPEIIK
jgi:hypothetical protein